MRFTYGPHAVANLEDRDLKREWVERTVFDPDTTEPDPNHLERMRAYRALPERDGRVLRVVYIPRDDGHHIVTAFLDRGRRRKA